MFTFVIKSTGSPQLIYNDKGSELEGRYFAYYNNVIKQKFKDDYSYNKFFGPMESAVAANIKALYFS